MTDMVYGSRSLKTCTIIVEKLPGLKQKRRGKPRRLKMSNLKVRSAFGDSRLNSAFG
jgi:hypothetical protein